MPLPPRVPTGALLASTLVLLTGPACSSDEEPVGPGATLTRIDAEPAGANCDGGGRAIRRGTDADGDGVLDDGEVSSTEYVCNGTAPPVLVRRDPEPPGAACPDGGEAIRSGADTDRDGVLDDGEIASTTYVCSEDEIWEGDFRGEQWSVPESVARIRRARVVTGTLTLDEAAAVDGVVSLPNLTLVGGALRTHSTAGLASVDLPALEQVGGEVWFFEDADLAAVHMPKLTTVGASLMMSYQDVLRELELPALASSGGLDIQAPGLPALKLPALHTIGGEVRIIFGSNLRTVELGQLSLVDGPLLIAYNPVLTRVDGLPQLAHVGGKLEIIDNDALTAVELPALNVVEDQMRVERNPALRRLGLASLEEAGGTFLAIDIRDSAALEEIAFDELRETGGPIWIRDVPALTTLTLPALRTIGCSELSLSLTVINAAVGSLELPSLREVCGTVLVQTVPQLTAFRADGLESADRISISYAAQLTTVSAARVTSLQEVHLDTAPLLTTVRFDALTAAERLTLWNVGLTDLAGFASLRGAGDVSVQGNPALSSLTGLDQLTHSRRLELDGLPALASLRALARLHTVGGSLTIAETALVSLEGLESLQHVAGYFNVRFNGKLESLAGLSRLRSIGRDFSVIGNRALATLAGIDELARVDGAVRFGGNDALPRAELDALLARLGKPPLP